MPLTCLSRTFDPADLAQLQRELQVVDVLGSPLPTHRRWEYALALHAAARWQDRVLPPALEGQWDRFLDDPLYDVGGFGSNFHHMLDEWTDRKVIIVDPAEDPDASTLEEWCIGGTRLADVVTCLSVLEYVEAPESFLYHLSCLLAPGGLLVLTFAFWNRCGADTAVGHETRHRIYCPKELTALRVQADRFLLQPFGGVDPTWHGTQVDDHTVASLVLEKRR